MSQSARHRTVRMGPEPPTPEERAAERARRIAGLPKWAQQELARAEQQRDHWRSVAEAGTEAAEPGNTSLVHFGGPDRAIERSLGTGAVIRFRLSGGGYVEARIDKQQPHQLKLTSHPFGLLVRPWVHNCVHVQVVDL